MGNPTPLRSEFDGPALRRLAKGSRDANSQRHGSHSAGRSRVRRPGMDGVSARPPHSLRHSIEGKPDRAIALRQAGATRIFFSETTLAPDHPSPAARAARTPRSGPSLFRQADQGKRGDHHYCQHRTTRHCRVLWWQSGPTWPRRRWSTARLPSRFGDTPCLPQKKDRSFQNGPFPYDDRGAISANQAALTGTPLSLNSVANSPSAAISRTMSQPPTNSPFTYSWGMVGQLE